MIVPVDIILQSSVHHFRGGCELKALRQIVLHHSQHALNFSYCCKQVKPQMAYTIERLCGAYVFSLGHGMKGSYDDCACTRG